MVTVIIVSFNTREITLKCLDCLKKSEGVELEKIVIDNASTDGTADEINKRFKEVKLIRNEANTGFARANNQGMALVRGEDILLLNSDCFVKPDTINKTLYAMSKVKADVAGCQLLNNDGTIQQSWGYFPTLKRIILMMLFIDNLPLIRDTVDSIHVRSESRYVNEAEADWVTGAFVMLKRGVWEKTSGIDEKYFMYGEETEWMYRIKQAGFHVWYLPAARAVHLVGASSPDRAPAVIGEMRGWRYWFSKHNQLWEQKVLPYAILIGCGLRIFLKPTWSEYYRQAFKEFWNEVSGGSRK